MVDVESDGPIPGDYSMVCFAAVLVEDGLKNSFYGRLRPISQSWIPDALAVSGFTREQTLQFDEPKEIMESFSAWLASTSSGKPRFISDNNGYDWGFINWYFHHFIGSNPFGHTSANLGSLYKGLQKDVTGSFKKLRQTAHTHHPLDDVLGNAEALLTLKKQYGLQL